MYVGKARRCAQFTTTLRAVVGVVVAIVAHASCHEALLHSAQGVWAPPRDGTCSNAACPGVVVPDSASSVAADPTGVAGCPSHSIVCYARACRFYDVCDRAHVRLWPNGTVQLSNALNSLGRLEAMVGSEPARVADDSLASCGRVVDAPVILAMDYFYLENYYHFHVDFLMRLFAQFERVESSLGVVPATFVALPAFPGPGIDATATGYWESAFPEPGRGGEPKPFWVQALEAIQHAGNQSGNVAGRMRSLHQEPVPGGVVPLFRDTMHLLADGEPLCLAHAYVGLPFVDLERGFGYNITHRGEGVAPEDDWTTFESLHLDGNGVERSRLERAGAVTPSAQAFMSRFVGRLRVGCGLPGRDTKAGSAGVPVVECEASAGGQASCGSPLRIGLISRKRRRVITNEGELLRTLKQRLGDAAIVELLSFETMTYCEQVRVPVRVGVVPSRS